ncbi:MAG TPA: ABC transporter permease [Pirellulales bacterium]|jgi:ABC-2 type transport system permease protein|nr:ABC transporter permease [Pirellulales bacterium]
MSAITTPLPTSDADRPNAPPLAVIRPRPWLAAWTLCRREWVRFIRQGNRVFAALGQPIIFWILFSALFGTSFQMSAGAAGQASSTAAASGPAAQVPAAVSYAQYFFPGTLVMIILFTAIFATISVIEDRREGFLQSVLVAPVPRWSVVTGKVLGGALIALAHAAVFMLLCFTLQVPLTLLTVPAVLVLLFVIGIALTSLGLAIAWPMQSTQGFHAIMMVFLLPMWLLSGALAPPGNNWIGWVIRFNPLTYCLALLRHILYWGADPAVKDTVLAGLPSAWFCTLVTLAFVVAMFGLAWRVASVRSTGDAT